MCETMALKFVEDLVDGASTVSWPEILKSPCQKALQGAAGIVSNGAVGGPDGAFGDIGVVRCSTAGGRKQGGADGILPCGALRLIADFLNEYSATRSV